MNGQIFFVLLIVITILLHDASLGAHAISVSNNFSTDHFSFNTPTGTCEDCIRRARNYYSVTISNPEQFCVHNYLCVKNPETSSYSPKTPSENLTILRSETPTIEPSTTDLDASLIIKKKEPDPISVLAEESYYLKNIFPTILPTTNAPSQTLSNFFQGTPTRAPTNHIKNSFPSDAPSPILTFHESLPTDAMNLDPILTNNHSQRTAISSLFLKNLNIQMDPEVANYFSIIALDFLRDNSMSLALSERIDFIFVKVVGQGPELGNSTEFEVHIDGMHIFFETIVNVKGDDQIELPWLMESIFKTNKNDFFFRLAESNEFFIPLVVENHSSQEVEGQMTPTSEFMNSWVVSSLSVVACSVFFTTLLLTKMIRRTRPQRFHHDSSKRNVYPLYTIEQTYSDDSTETNKTPDENRKNGNATNPRDKNDLVDILMNLEGESLAGLKLLQSEDNDSLAHSSRDTGSYTKKKCETNKLSTTSKIDTIQESKGERQPGHNARTRKRQIEQEFQKRRLWSEENTSMGAILIATSSFNCDGDVGAQRLSIEIATGQCENLSPPAVQKKSIMDQISTIFRTKNKKQQIRRLEPNRIIEEDCSDLSSLSTPAHSPSKGLNSFCEAIQNNRTDEANYLSINTNALPKSLLKGDKYRFCPEAATAVSPKCATTYANLSKKKSTNRPNPIKTYFISSPISKRLQGSRTTTQEIRHQHY